MADMGKPVTWNSGEDRDANPVGVDSISPGPMPGGERAPTRGPTAAGISQGIGIGNAKKQNIDRYPEGFTYQYARWRLTDAWQKGACARVTGRFTLALRCMGAQVTGNLMRMLLTLLLPMAWSAAHAQHIYKCTDGNQVSYQSLPCEGAQSTLRHWDATPEPAAALAQAAQAAKAHALPVRKASSRRTTTHRPPSRPDAAESRCQAAKSKREAKLQAVGLKRTFGLLRKLDDAVYAACR